LNELSFWLLGMKKNLKILLFCLLFSLLLIAENSDAQPPPPYPCTGLVFCPGGCQADGVTCWDIDDPIPLDEGVIVLLGAGIIFGIYKLKSVRQLQ
jgi:hypothetical protein